MDARVNLGLVLMRLGRHAEALPQFRAAVETAPEHVQARNGLAGCLVRIGRGEEAVAAYREVIRLQPDWVEPMRRLAWLHATHPSPAVQDPSRAVQLAEQVVRRSDGRDPVMLDTLAAAYASAGRFAEAVATAERAAALAAERRPAVAREIQRRKRLYEQGRPYREG